MFGSGIISRNKLSQVPFGMVFYHSSKEVANIEIGTKKCVRLWNFGLETWLDSRSRTLEGHSNRSLKNSAAENNVCVEA